MTTPTPQVTELPEDVRKALNVLVEGYGINEVHRKMFSIILKKALTERDTLWQERVDELNSQIIRLKSDIAHAIGFCRGVGHPENYLEKYYSDLIPEQKEKEDV